MMRRLLDKARLSLLRALLPRDEKLKEELAKLWLPRSPHSIWLGWDDVDMGGKRIRRVGTPIEDEDVARKKDVEQAGMPVGEAGDMIYHDGEKWTALKAPAAEKWLKHPGDGAAPEWSDLPAVGADPASFLEYDGWWEFRNHFHPENCLVYTTSGSASITWQDYSIKLETGTTADSGAYVMKRVLPYAPPLHWDHKRRLRVRCHIYYQTGCDIRIFFGYIDLNVNHFGFRIVDNTIYGHAANTDANAHSEVSLMTITEDSDLDLYAIFYPGEKVEFYINGQYKGEVTENLPTGTGSSGILFYLYIRNTVAENKKLQVFECRSIIEP